MPPTRSTAASPPEREGFRHENWLLMRQHVVARCAVKLAPRGGKSPSSNFARRGGCWPKLQIEHEHTGRAARAGLSSWRGIAKRTGPARSTTDEPARGGTGGCQLIGDAVRKRPENWRASRAERATTENEAPQGGSGLAVRGSFRRRGTHRPRWILQVPDTFEKGQAVHQVTERRTCIRSRGTSPGA